MKQKFNVTGMTCSACSAHVEKAVSRLDGVQKAEVSLMTNSMTVQYDEDVLSPGGIIDAGYRGEIKVILHNTSTSRINFRCGDRIAQLVITPVETPRIRKVVNFTDTTERGGNGFGSTGR